MGCRGILLLSLICLLPASSMILRHKRELQKVVDHHNHHEVALAMWRWEDFGRIIVDLLMLMLACFIKVMVSLNLTLLLNLPSSTTTACPSYLTTCRSLAS